MKIIMLKSVQAYHGNAGDRILSLFSEGGKYDISEDLAIEFFNSGSCEMVQENKTLEIENKEAPKKVKK